MRQERATRQNELHKASQRTNSRARWVVS
jgi:hypothetical protein